MSHTYVISSVSTLGDQTTVTGTVDGTPVTVQFWTTSQSQAAMASAIAFHNFIAPLMLAAVPPTPVSSPAHIGSFTL